MGGLEQTLIGIGSRACGDDAIGLHLVERLGARSGVRTHLWEHRDAFDIASGLLELDAAVMLVDCADMGLAPGSWRAFDADDARLAQAVNTVSTHGFGLADALALARTLGHDQPVRVFGVQPFDIRPGQAALSAAMDAQVDGLAEALWRQLVDPDAVATTVALHGVVQGVGMRPTLARLAKAAGLGGWVTNLSGSVHLRLEGPPDDVRSFLAELPARLPVHARIDRTEHLSHDLVSELTTFEIRPSEASGRPAVIVPADLVVCSACLSEVRDPGDRRHGYPFTTCTDCGPRYSVVERTPYDRERTTLARFPLCSACAREYADVDDRRFHAESIACPRCGPTLTALSAAGEPLAGDALHLARAALASGGIIALRGIGGFALAVNARDPAAIARLRRLKQRPEKPLALMAASVEAIERVCAVDGDARAALLSPPAPIVLLDARGDADGLPRDALSPDTDTLGVMVPTSPLHDLLFRPLAGDPTPAFDWLVMTSGNACGEPICLDTASAIARLGGADLLLTHDREIAWRADDSIVAPRPGGVRVHRRARGYAPAPIALRWPLDRAVLAMGAGLKNTVALGFDRQLALSPHIGDLDDPATVDAFEALAAALPRLLDRRPCAIAVDLHPDLASTRAGERLAERLDVPLVRVQHHHAHAAAALAENGVAEGLALVFDGVGLGHDGALWGGELLHVDSSGATRLGTFESAPLPGGDAAVLEPRRQLVGRLHALGRSSAVGLGETAAVETWLAQCGRGVNAPQTHAVGRLFDSIAALLGLAPERVSWEGQAAIRLETAARRSIGVGAGIERLELPIRRDADGLYLVDWRPLFEAWLDAPLESVESVSARALEFHRALARASVRLARRGLAETGPLPVALTGGVFQNRLLADLVRAGLRDAGVRGLEHRQVPTNDGGIAFGQAIVAGRVH